MIEPTSKDIGRFVVYGDAVRSTVEAGRVTSFNEATVFVCFPKRHIRDVTVQGCSRCDLYWLDELFGRAVPA